MNQQNLLTSRVKNKEDESETDRYKKQLGYEPKYKRRYLEEKNLECGINIL